MSVDFVEVRRRGYDDVVDYLRESISEGFVKLVWVQGTPLLFQLSHLRCSGRHLCVGESHDRNILGSQWAATVQMAKSFSLLAF